MQQYDPKAYGQALSTALEALGAAVEERDRAIQVMVARRDAEQVMAALETAADAPAKVDAGLAALATGVAPDDYHTMAMCFLLAMQALLAQWPAEVASYSHGALGHAHDAALKSGEAKRATMAFVQWWGKFQGVMQRMERDVPDLARSLRLTAAARRVIDKADWVRTFPA